MLGGHRARFERLHAPLLPELARACGQTARQRRLLLERAQGRPEGALGAVLLLRRERGAAKGVTDSTAKAQLRSVVHLVERAGAIGAGHADGGAERCLEL